LVNTFGDLRGSLAAVERINSVLSGVQVDDALAYGLERELKQKAVNNDNLKLFFSDGSSEKNQNNHLHYMSALKTSTNLFSLAWSGDICLEGIYLFCNFIIPEVVLFECMIFICQQPCLLMFL
jgi:ATP-binding cassette subfamily B (MDR/TAP) protein 8